MADERSKVLGEVTKGVISSLSHGQSGVLPFNARKTSHLKAVYEAQQ